MMIGVGGTTVFLTTDVIRTQHHRPNKIYSQTLIRKLVKRPFRQGIKPSQLKRPRRNQIYLQTPIEQAVKRPFLVAQRVHLFQSLLIVAAALIQRPFHKQFSS